MPSGAGDDPASMRGYKIVNGKKTSYFHTELTDEAKALLEKNAGPKKISKEEAAKTLKDTAARHTYDNYQAKWDKWDNEEFFERAMAQADADDGGAAKSKAAKQTTGDCCGTVADALQTACIRVLPACIMGVMAWFRPPQSETGWIVFVAIAVASVAANRPQRA